MKSFANIADMKSHIGQHCGYSEWLTVEQERINNFADCTLDHQWIHIDADKAAKGPFKTPIAHGFLTLSFGPYFMEQIFEVKSVKMGVNYGLDKMRFTSPVPVNSRVRMGATLAKIEDNGPKGTKCFWDVVYEIEGSERPACVATWISMVFE